jgi:hypothetical protein
MKRHEWLIALAVLAGYVAFRGTALFGPFILPFETAFQEAIALHHHNNGIAANRFIPVFATIDGQNFYHTSHPPLLHVVYAGLYKVFGVREWVTRLFSLGLFFLSALLWRALLGKDERLGWLVFPLAFALPIPFLLCTTTNYELLSIFFISLIAWLVLKRGAGLAALLPALTLGLLVDWPVYLAVPVLCVLKWRDRKMRSILIWLFAYEAVFFAGLQVYYFFMTGEAAFFSHQPSRANPLALFSLQTWGDLFSHFAGVMGRPLALVSAGGAGAWVISVIRSKSSGPAGFFALFLSLLIVAAPRLVSLHYVYLLYFTPFLVFALHHALSRVSTPRVALAAFLVLALSHDYILAQHRNPSYFGMADRLKSAGAKTAFSASAVGALYFYDGIETVHPVSIAGYDWLKTNRPDLIQTDARYGESRSFSDLFLISDYFVFGTLSRFTDYKWIFSFTRESLLAKPEIASRLPEYIRDRNSTFVMAGPGRDCPGGAWIQTAPSYGHNISDCKIPLYGIRQPPGPGGASLKIMRALKDKVNKISVKPAIVHSIRAARSDGVTFLALAEYDNKRGGSERKLELARFVSGAREMIPSLDMELGGANRLVLVTTPGPKANAAFDDAYWLEPIITRDNPGKER